MTAPVQFAFALDQRSCIGFHVFSVLRCNHCTDARCVAICP
jgi:Fe-S-cluster-containing dehydrogenase component